MGSVRPYSRNAAAGPALLFVKAEWCPHCQHTKPEMRKAAAILGSVLPVYSVDSDKNADVVRQLNVDGFPTIFFRTADGRLKTYRGERVGQKIADWACAQSGMCGR
mgnify:CR=1 FL=1